MKEPELLLVTLEQAARLLDVHGADRLFSSEELGVLDSLRWQDGRADWLAGRLAAKALLRRNIFESFQLELPLSSIWIRNEPTGAPFFEIRGSPEFQREWNISIAHDAGYGICALAATPEAGFVGVDLEVERPLPPEVLRYFLSPEERRLLPPHAPGGAAGIDGNGASPEARLSAMALWALKEAVLKAARRVPVRSLREVSLAWTRAGGVTARLAKGSGGGASIGASFQRWGPHVVACATCRQTGDVPGRP